MTRDSSRYQSFSISFYACGTRKPADCGNAGLRHLSLDQHSRDEHWIIQLMREKRIGRPHRRDPRAFPVLPKEEALRLRRFGTTLLIGYREKLIGYREKARHRQGRRRWQETEDRELRSRARTVDGYVWRTAGDSDVRSSHKKMNGKFVRWDDPPQLDNLNGDAGALPNCRCYPEPLIPEMWRRNRLALDRSGLSYTPLGTSLGT